MSNQEIADKMFNSYYLVTKEEDPVLAKQHCNYLIDAQIQLMLEDSGISIIDAGRDVWLEDWEVIRYLISIK